MSKEKPRYKINLQMAGISYKTVGETMLEALASIPLDWHDIKAKAIINIRKGSKKYEHIIYLKPLRRVFANKTSMLLLAKRLTILLK